MIILRFAPAGCDFQLQIARQHVLFQSGSTVKVQPQRRQKPVRAVQRRQFLSTDRVVFKK